MLISPSFLITPLFPLNLPSISFPSLLHFFSLPSKPFYYCLIHAIANFIILHFTLIISCFYLSVLVLVLLLLLPL
ncbi:hypothetical protein RIF29_24085 [Crotalaria pallida]|uniref:Uncharacterized protein n=1 Tax=Crotalaria pallida TaxID=3830 RepID=A0AAN9I2X0_CROPI